MKQKREPSQVLDFTNNSTMFDLLQPAPAPARRRGRPPGSKDRRPRKRELIGLRPRLEALIEKALDFQLDKGVPFVEAVALAMQAKPLEALKVFAMYMPQEIHAEVHSVAELHLSAIRQLSMVDVTPQRFVKPPRQENP